MSKYIIDVGDAYVRHGLERTLTIPVRINEHEDHWMDTRIPVTPYTEHDTEKVREEAYRQGYDKGYGTQKQEEEQIQIGDEVRNIKNGWIAVVSNIDGECMTLMDADGALGDGYHVNRFTKTGRHFPEIAAVLAKMKEDTP